MNDKAILLKELKKKKSELHTDILNDAIDNTVSQIVLLSNYIADYQQALRAAKSMIDAVAPTPPPSPVKKPF
jgi:hypothetical protein